VAKQQQLIRSTNAHVRIDHQRPSAALLIFYPDNNSEVHVEVERATLQKLRDSITVELRRGLSRRGRPSIPSPSSRKDDQPHDIAPSGFSQGEHTI
jgi:hypothetical protein